MTRRSRKAKKVARLDYLVRSTQQRQDRVRALARKEAREDHRDFGSARVRQGHPIYDASYAEAWQELTGKDLWNDDKWASGRARAGNPHRPGGSNLYARGARIKFVDRFGKTRSGKIVFSNPGGWLTLNMGGPHGTPQVIHEDDVIDWGTHKKGNPMRFYMLSPRGRKRRNPSRRRRSTRRRSRRRNYASDFFSPFTANPRRRARRSRRSRSRRRNPTRRRRGPTRAASRKGGRKAARMMRRIKTGPRAGQFAGLKRSARRRNPSRRRVSRRRSRRYYY